MLHAGIGAAQLGDRPVEDLRQALVQEIGQRVPSFHSYQCIVYRKLIVRPSQWPPPAALEGDGSTGASELVKHRNDELA
jgi:hypothetical protein